MDKQLSNLYFKNYINRHIMKRMKSVTSCKYFKLNYVIIVIKCKSTYTGLNINIIKQNNNVLREIIVI